MARPTSKRTARRTARPATSQPALPNIVTGALDVGSQVGRAAIKTAQGALAAAARFVVGAPKAPEPKVTPPSGPPDSRLPEAALNAIVEARRRARTEAGARGSAKRKPPTGSSSRTESSAPRSRRRMKA